MRQISIEGRCKVYLVRKKISNLASWQLRCELSYGELEEIKRSLKKG